MKSTANTEQAAAYIEEQATETLSEAQPTVKATPLEVVAEIVEQTSEAVQVEEATEGAVRAENVALTTVNAEEESVAPTAAAQEEGAALVEEAVVPTAAVVEQVVVERVAEGINNIADALVKLENEVKAAEVRQKLNDIYI